MRKTILVAAFAGYLALLFYLTLFLRPSAWFPLGAGWNAVPLRNISHDLRTGGWPMVVNLVGNLVAFLPLGVLWPLIRDGRTNARGVGLVGGSLSLLIESLQLLSGSRVADVDDILLNSAGGVLGFLAYRGVREGCGLARARLEARAGSGN